MTEFQNLEIRIASAQELKNVKLLGKMHTYVVAYVDPAQKSSTHVDKKGGKDPVWNEKLNLTIAPNMLQRPDAVLMLEIFAISSTSQGNKLVGFVRVAVPEILRAPNGGTEFASMSYEVKRASGRVQGRLNFGVRLGQRSSTPDSRASEEPVMAYPATGLPYPPPQYQQPPVSSQSYPHAYPPLQHHQQHFVNHHKPPKKNRLGGAGMGLGAGLLGGLLIGDMIGNSYDYDGYGGGDFGGGDFGGGDFGGDFGDF